MGWFVSDADGTLSSMEVFIAQARNSNPFLNFVIANVPQRTFIGGRDDLITKTDDYNAKLAAILPQWSIKDSPIYLADLRDWYDCEPDGCPAGKCALGFRPSSPLPSFFIPLFIHFLLSFLLRFS